jgi:hypothetical protein
MKNLFVLLTILAGTLLFVKHATAQQPKGYIVEIDENSVMVDYTSKDVKVGDRLQVMSEPKTMIHPVTKKKIVKDAEVIATLEITDTQEDYSVAGKVFPPNAIEKIKAGNKVLLIKAGKSKAQPKDNKINVAIADATVNDVVGIGYFGNYAADLLMQEMLDCDKIRLIDRTMLNAQVAETNLAKNGYINSSSAITKGRIAGVQYMIQVTMQKPDVTNISTGIPIHSILTAAGRVASIAGANATISKSLDAGSTISSNAYTAKLKSAVSITARIIDVNTGEVLFMCSGTGTAQGESQLALEEGALGGLQINGGVDGFKQTVTGKAIALAYRKIGQNLKSYFNGETTEKVVNENMLHNEITLRKGSLYMGVNKLSNDEIKEIFSYNPQLYFDYKKANSKSKWGKSLMYFGGAMGLLFTFDTIVGERGHDDKWYSASDLTFQKTLFGIIASGGVFYGGLHWFKTGKSKTEQCVDIYNSRFKKKNPTAQLSLGVAPQGLALRVTF